MPKHRRQVLAATAGAAVTSTVGLAGCLEGLTGGEKTDENGNETDRNESDDPSGDITIDPSGTSMEYTTWLPTDDDPVAFAYVDWAVSQFQGYEDDDEDDDDEGDTVRDPMMDLPMNGARSIVPSAVGAALAEADLIELLAEPGTDDAAVFDSTVTGLLAVNDSSVVTGDIDRDEIGERLTTEPEGLYPIQFDLTDDHRGYDIYTGTNRDKRVAALGDDAIVYRHGDGALETVRSLVDDHLEGAAPEADDEVAWLTETAGRGYLTFGGYGGPPAMEVTRIGVESQSYDVAARYDALSAVDGVVASVGVEDATDADSLAPEDAAVASSFAASFETAADVPSSLEDRLGAEATDRTVTTDGNRISATARWAEESDSDGDAAARLRRRT